MICLAAFSREEESIKSNKGQFATSVGHSCASVGENGDIIRRHLLTEDSCRSHLYSFEVIRVPVYTLAESLSQILDNFQPEMLFFCTSQSLNFLHFSIAAVSSIPSPLVSEMSNRTI